MRKMKIVEKWITKVLPSYLVIIFTQQLAMSANNGDKRTPYRIGILRHPDHAQSQLMFTSALSFVNNLGGSIELVPFFINASTTENTAVEMAMYHEANELCSKLCGVGVDLDSRSLVALLTVAPHRFVFAISAELGLPIFSASTVPTALGPRVEPTDVGTSSEVVESQKAPALPQIKGLTTPQMSLKVALSEMVSPVARKTPTQPRPTTTRTAIVISSSVPNQTSPPSVRYLGPDVLGPMFSFIIRQQWLTFVYISDGKEGLERYQWLREQLDQWSTVQNRFKIYLICLDQISHPPTLFHSTRYLQTEDSPFVDKFILDMSTEKKYDMLLMELKDLGMTAAPYHFYFVKNVIGELDLGGFEKGGAVFYGYQLLSPANPLYRSVMRHMYGSDDTTPPLPSPPFFDPEKLPQQQLEAVELSKLTTAESLVFDQIFYLKTLLETLFNNASTRNLLEAPQMHRLPKCGENFVPVSCQPSFLTSARSANSQLDEFKADGLTGWVHFDESGRRRGHLLALMELSLDKPLRSIATLRDDGEWVDGTGKDSATWSGSRDSSKKASTIVLNVTTIDSAPFVLLIRNRTMGSHRGATTTTPSTTGETSYVINDHEFEGFCVDLANEIGRLLKIKFYFRHVADGQYGSQDPVTKHWSGMVGELIRGDADVAIAPLTILADRERVVQMTKPYLNTGISIMIKNPEKQQPGVFTFLEPLSSAIWVCTLFAYCGTAVCMWILCRLNNGEMVTPFRNSFWSALCALLGLGGEFSPKSFSGRLLATVWYFFCLILISSYTANMTAFFTIERLEMPIKSVEDLIRQDRIQFGTLDSGSTKGFFQTSTDPLYWQMWEIMNNTQPSVFVKSVKEGVERVRNSGGRYAFLLESAMNAYYNQKSPCNTMRVGRLLDSKGYGLVTPLGSAWHAELNYAVLLLNEIGVIQQLVNKWWLDKGECPQEQKQQDLSGPLNLNNVTGVFFILVGGLVLGIFFSVIEFAVAAAGLSRRTKVNFPVAARELLSGCILGSANKTIRPLHSLDLLARVLPWVEMPNFSATMLLNRLDAISPHDPRRKYVAAACLRKYVSSGNNGIVQDQSTSSNMTKSISTSSNRPVTLPKVAPSSQSQTELFHHRRAMANDIPLSQGLSRSQTLPSPLSKLGTSGILQPLVTDLGRRVVCSSETSSSLSTSSPSVTAYGWKLNSDIVTRAASVMRNRRLKPQIVKITTSTSTSTTEEERQVREIIATRSPSCFQTMPPILRMPETLQLRPVTQISMQSRLGFEGLQRSQSGAGAVSLFEILTKPGNATLTSSGHLTTVIRPQDLKIGEEECFEQQRWYEYRENDLTNL